MKQPKLLADENIAAPMVNALGNAGWDIVYVTDRFPGALDHEVLKLAQDENRILLTEDKDFGDLVVRAQGTIRRRRKSQ